ncbi:MAG: alginate export family protein [Planctomycetota bacterium]|nr:alginate export family protein [Planctomycetota bacterium]
MRLSVLAVGVPILGVGAAAWGQASVERFERKLEHIQRETRLLVNAAIPAEQRAFFDYGAYVGVGFFSIDDVQQNTHLLSQYDLVGYARLNIDNVHEFFVRGRASYRHILYGGDFEGEGDESLALLEQGYYRFDLARYLGAYKKQATENNVIFQGGREFVYWANGLVLAQYMDGATVDVKVGDMTLTMLGGVTINETIDFDTSRPDFDDDTSRGFYGGMLSGQVGKHRPYVYGLVQRDYNDNDKRIDRISSPPLVTRFDYNSYYIGVGSNGAIGDRMVYGVEAVYEGGEGLSSSVNELGEGMPQVEKDISAWALDARLDYLLGGPKRMRLSAETIVASGDVDRLTTSSTLGGNLSGKDTAFNSMGLLNTGLAFAPPVSNLVMLRVGASAYPFGNSGALRRLQVGTDLLFYAKYAVDAPIDELTEHERFLGVEPDLYLNWQVTSDITLAVRYGVFFPGAAIVENDNPRNFFYVGMTFAF